ncbi:secretory calcium-binding phosphoprotein 9 [Lates japonicus]|uniref:Secretory calcium-binding phosphoprotein 9 n=1 Tax=Lates japonicus TaxID=270547 RepID=A0AAD3N3D1_LATJO|nr:secretory calcium-binding phosphoprotein 9 [Lates japonicus]
MKLLLTTFVATICYVSAGKRQRMMAAMNGGMMGGMNGGMVNGANPGMMAGGLNPPMVAGGGAGFIGQPQFAQGITGGAMPQQLPIQPDPLRRFRRQIMTQGNTMRTTVDTQIPAPTDPTTTTLCDEDDHHEEN